MKDDQLRALLIVGALLSGASSTSGFVGGRMSVADPPAEVRLIRLPPRIIRMAPAEAAPAEPVAPDAPAPPTSVAPAPTATELPAIESPVPVETTPLPLPRPKIQSKPDPKPPPKPQPKTQSKAQPRPEKTPPKPRQPAPTNDPLPSCAVIKRQYDRMNYSQRMSAYFSATPEEIAHGRRCLGL